MAREAIELIAPHFLKTIQIMYVEYVRDPANAFSTQTLPFPGGLELTVKLLPDVHYTINGFGTGPLYNPPANSTIGQPTLAITAVNGVAAPANPQGNYLSPDIQIAAGSAVTVSIAAQNVPTATVVNLRLDSNVSGDTLVQCSPLEGTIAS